MPSRFTRIAVHVLICCLGVTSCTTVREIALPADGPIQQVPDIRVGDHVIVLLKSGRSEAFRVTSVGTAAVYGAKQSILYRDIQSLEIRNFNGRRTLWLGVGIVVGFLALVYAALLVAISEEE